MENFELIGHVFHQFATKNPIHCHSLCVDDCRCLSFNYKENNEKNVCDLNDASHFTDPSSIKHSPGSRYYNLRRAFMVYIIFATFLGNIYGQVNCLSFVSK